MRQALKRIEATLDHLESQGFDAQHLNSTVPKTSTFHRAVSLIPLLLDSAISDKAPVLKSSPPLLEAAPIAPAIPSFAVSPRPEPVPVNPEWVQPDSVASRQPPLPMLPKLKPLNFTSHRNGANPALAVNLLREIEQVVVSWQDELQQILRQIQDLYLEGPIVDGWLESQPQESETDVSPLRHTEVERLLHFVDEVCNPQTKGEKESVRTAGYRLCGLNPDGQLWCRDCPPEQVPSVSLAIARYHKLRQLLTRKQELETRLSQLSEALIVMHGHLHQ
ncbi:MAG: hypothetical protein KME16_22965 [Scytolyngbya sp. HA4215-MV1]|jgi:hypothetical protein|nr:hypothetical protein [Scytolyngbya sp. HA4215-MV1]